MKAFFEYALDHRLSVAENGGKHQFFVIQDINSLFRELGCPLPAADPANGRRQRRAEAGVEEIKVTPIAYSSKVRGSFKWVTRVSDNKPILVRWVKRSAGIAGKENKKAAYRWCPVVPVEEVPTLVVGHHERAVGTCGIQALYHHLAYKVPTTVTRPDGTTCTLEGLEGFDRECLSIFLEASAVRADQAATKPDEKPPVQPIRVQRAFQQCQGDLVDLGEGRDPAFRYVLVYVELLTRRVWLRPLRSKSALECVREIYNIWMDTQVPAVLQTDNGKEFGNLLEELCGHFGVRLIHGSVGHPQSQGATERTNQTFKDIISGQLIICPTVNWSFHVRRVQTMLNSKPRMRLKGLTANEALFGAPEACPLQPPAVIVANLLQLDSYAEAAVEEDADNVHQAAQPSTGKGGGRKPAPPTTGRKRNAAATELPEAAQPIKRSAPAAESAQAAGPPRRSQRQRAGYGIAAAVQAELCSDSDAEDAAAAGQAPTAGAGPSTAAGRSATPSPPGGLLHLAAAAALEEEMSDEEGVAAAAMGLEAGPSSQQPAEIQLPSHLAPARERCLAQQTENCRVVGIPPARQYGAGGNYRLRCNSGVIQGTFPARNLKKANAQLAAELQFADSEVAGVPVVSLAAAKSAHLSNGILHCRCRASCSAGCPCKLAKALCGRHCRCSHGKGANCGNCDAQ